jgi:molecular chaperone DnaK (HSP70)
VSERVTNWYVVCAAVGVDLGTTFSVVGVKQSGAVSIVRDAQGRALVPSVVAFLDNGEGMCVCVCVCVCMCVCV